MTHHPRAVGRALVYVAELLFDQRTDTVIVAVMATVLRQILAANDLWLMRAALVALVRNAIVRRQHRQHRRCREPRCRKSAARTRHLCLPFAHAAPFPERSAGSASIVIERHLVFPPLRRGAALSSAAPARRASRR